MDRQMAASRSSALLRVSACLEVSPLVCQDNVFNYISSLTCCYGIGVA